MNFKPILFSTEMVQAILEDRKTKTRRVSKRQPKEGYLPILMYDHFGKPYYENRKDAVFVEDKIYTCPYGNTGDVLWVRETFASEGFIDNYIYKADGVCHETDYGKWKPSIFMPKEACRLFLKIKSIKIERLQGISENDSIAEGCSLYGPFDEYRGAVRVNGGSMKYNAFKKASSAFKNVWETINSEESWKSNPWVWVIEFEKIEEPENFLET